MDKKTEKMTIHLSADQVATLDKLLETKSRDNLGAKFTRSAYVSAISNRELKRWAREQAEAAKA